MDPQVHPDPFHEAMSRGLQRAIQVASSAVTGMQVLVHLRKAEARMIAQRDEHARRALSAQIDAGRAAARADWAPALDEDWIRGADLASVARIWGAAMPYADALSPWHEPAAGTAMRRCEDRLRVLHPYAMARYDGFRADGTAPLDAMHKTAPFFGYSPAPASATPRPLATPWQLPSPAPPRTPVRQPISRPAARRNPGPAQTATSRPGGAGGRSSTGSRPAPAQQAGPNPAPANWPWCWKRRPACPAK